ncbi:MAG: hypothetical protein WKG07_23510 [Hymenobacter sp.]
MTPDLLPLSHAVAALCRQAAQFIRQQVTDFDASKIESKGLHDMVSYVDKGVGKNAGGGPARFTAHGRFRNRGRYRGQHRGQPDRVPLDN